MTLEEFSDYVLTLSAQVAGEPTASPVLDASMAVEFLLPAILRQVTRDAFDNDRFRETLVKEHELVTSGGSAALPAGLEEEFARSLQVSVGELRDRVLIGTWNANTKQFTITGGGSFTAADVGKHAVIKDSGGTTQADAHFALRVSSSVGQLDVAAGSGSFTNSTMTLYSTNWVQQKTLSSINMSSASNTVTINGGVLAQPDDVGKMIQIYSAPNVLRLTTLISVFEQPNIVETFDVNPGADIDSQTAIVFLPTATRSKIGLFTHYPNYSEFLGITGEILPRFSVRDGAIFFKDANDGEFTDGTVLYVQGVTVPQVPTLSTDQIPVSEQIMDECLLMTAAILRGERSMASIGIETEEAKS